MENKFLIGVHAVIINEKKQLLVIRRSQKNDFMPLQWDLPGGTVEPNEEIRAALAREVKEELSATVEIGTPIDIYDCLENGIHCLQISFLCRLGGDVELQLNPDEHDRFLWASAEMLKELDKMGFLESVEKKLSLYGL